MHLADKKILYLITQTHYGGAQKYLLSLARYFKNGNTIDIAVGEASHQDQNFFDEARSLGIKPTILNKLVRDVSLVKAVEALFQIRSLLYKLRPDILHINSSMAGAVGSCAAWLYNLDPLNKPIRVVYTAHGFVFNEPMPSWKQKLYIFIERISAGWKHAIITVSEYDKQQGLTHSIANEQRFFVIHPGVDRQDISLLPREDARAALGIAQETRFVIGTIASLYKTKGIANLIDAARLLQARGANYLFCIIGDGPEKEMLQKLVQKYELHHSVMFVGAKKQAARYLSAFDMFALSSVKEGFPYVLLEAGHAGLPLVATRVGGIPEILAPECADALVDPANPQQLANTLEHFVSSPQVREKHASLCTKKITSQFTRERMLADTEHLYERLCKTAAPRTTRSSSSETHPHQDDDRNPPRR